MMRTPTPCEGASPADVRGGARRGGGREGPGAVGTRVSGARTCGWCGRVTAEFIVHDIDADHGPTEVVWCRDWRACHTARGARSGAASRES